MHCMLSLYREFESPAVLIPPPPHAITFLVVQMIMKYLPYGVVRLHRSIPCCSVQVQMVSTVYLRCPYVSGLSNLRIILFKQQNINGTPFSPAGPQMVGHPAEVR
jgi:hypothetical protein